jgi:hypothetical protein
LTSNYFTLSLSTQESLEMNVKKLLVDSVTACGVTLTVYVVVTWLWNFIVLGADTVDWAASLRFAIVFGIIVPWIGSRRCAANCTASTGTGRDSPSAERGANSKGVNPPLHTEELPLASSSSELSC